MSSREGRWFLKPREKAAAFAYFEAYPAATNYRAEHDLHFGFWKIVDLRALYTTEQMYQRERRAQRALSA